MTVRELIEKLRQMPQELEVEFDGDEGLYRIEEVTVYDAPSKPTRVLLG